MKTAEELQRQVDSLTLEIEQLRKVDESYSELLEFIDGVSDTIYGGEQGWIEKGPKVLLRAVRDVLRSKQAKIERFTEMLEWVWASTHQDVSNDQIREYLRPKLAKLSETTKDSQSATSGTHDPLGEYERRERSGSVTDKITDSSG